MSKRVDDDVRDRGDDLRDRPIGELVKQLAQETSTLVRQELELAKVEATEKGKKAGVAFALWGAAGVAGLFALGALTAFLIMVLDKAMPGWAAALIVTGVWLLVGAVLFLLGRKRVEEAKPVKPEQTIETIKEDVEWAKAQTRSESR